MTVAASRPSRMIRRIEHPRGDPPSLFADGKERITRNLPRRLLDTLTKKVNVFIFQRWPRRDLTFRWKAWPRRKTPPT